MAGDKLVNYRKSDSDDARTSVETVFQGIVLPPSSRKEQITDKVPIIELPPYRYERKAPLGKGGMSEVELCKDNRLGRAIARKTLSAKYRDSPDHQRRFVREIQIQAQLEHPSIVPVFDYDTNEEGDIFFTMRRISGTTLQEAIRNLRKIEDIAELNRQRNRLLNAFLQSSLAIDYAHHHGVIHRDLKPANLMLGDFGEVYVLDWGIAKVLSEEEEIALTTDSKLQLETQAREQTEGRILLGTPVYMPPEQYSDSSQVTQAADVYALGLILFEILTLQRPERQKMGALRTWPMQAALQPSRLFPELHIPAEYDWICQKACSLKPEERFASVRELHGAVQNILQGDRDLELRQQLADEHLQTAMELQQEQESPELTTESLQKVGRALALNPGNDTATELVTEWLLTPLDEIPEELHKIHQVSETRDSRRGLTSNAIAVTGIILLILFVLPWLEMKQLNLFLAGFVPAVAGLLLLILNKAGSEVTVGTVLRSISTGFLFACPVFFSTFAFGPFALPPLLTCIISVLTVGVVDIGWRRLIVMGFSFGALLTVFGMYVFFGVTLGVHWSATTMHLQASMFEFSLVSLFLGGLLFVFLNCIVIIVVWNNMDELVKSRRKVQQFEWKLRQLASLPGME
jgi:serine/threonine-protein kinase